MRLQGRVAVVTGASRGIGRAIAAAYAREGAVVAACSLHGPSEADPGFLADVAPATTGRSFLVGCDVRSSESVRAFCQRVLAEVGPPDVLVNNAGTVVRSALVDLEEDSWDDVIASNLKGTFLVTKAFLPSLRGRPGARIVNVASIAGRQGTPMLSAYCAAKHGVVGLTRALAEELRDDGIAVNAICPGSVDTDMLKIGMPGGTPRMSPEDVARVAVFLAADAPSALTGSCVDVFG